jgi:ribosomal protein S18 acetylase RimI-like enzyme
MVSYSTFLGQEGERRTQMLSPLAVDAAFQRRGIGSALVRTAETLMAEHLLELHVASALSPRRAVRRGP